MAYIKVDHSQCESTASAIDAYVSRMKERMGRVQGEIATLSSNWQGADAAQFRTQWDTVTSGDSTYTKMVQSLESYAKYLRHAANKYKEAQSNAVNRANDLPKW